MIARSTWCWTPIPRWKKIAHSIVISDDHARLHEGASRTARQISNPTHVCARLEIELRIFRNSPNSRLSALFRAEFNWCGYARVWAVRLAGKAIKAGPNLDRIDFKKQLLAYSGYDQQCRMKSQTGKSPVWVLKQEPARKALSSKYQVGGRPDDDRQTLMP